MSTLTEQLFTQNHWLADGTQTVWNFSFEDGYLSPSYVKAYTVDLLGDIIQLTVVPADLIAEFQLQILPAVPANYTLVIYRDTPKDAPLVNFTDGSAVTESNLDLISRQAIHVAAEVLDGSGVTLISDEIGFRSMKQVAYTGVSTVLLADNGKAHFKTDGTAVTVPNTLAVGFLSTIINHSNSTLAVTFSSGVGVLQGAGAPAGAASWTLAAKSALTIMKVASGVWYISGPVV